MKNILKIISVDADVANIPAAVRNQGAWIRKVTGDLSVPDNAAFTFAGKIFHKFESPSLFAVTLPSRVGWGLCYPASDLYGADSTLLTTVSISSPLLQPTSLGEVPVARITGSLTVYVGEEAELPFYVDVKVPTLTNWQLETASLTPVGNEGFSKVTYMSSSLLAFLPLKSIALRKGLCLVVASRANITAVRIALQAAGAENIGSLASADGHVGNVWIVPGVMTLPLDNAFYRPVISVTSSGMNDLPERVSDVKIAATAVVDAVAAMREDISEKLNDIASALAPSVPSVPLTSLLISGFAHRKFYFSQFAEGDDISVQMMADADGQNPQFVLHKYSPSSGLIGACALLGGGTSIPITPIGQELPPAPTYNKVRIYLSITPILATLTGTLGVSTPQIQYAGATLVESHVDVVTAAQVSSVSSPATFEFSDVKYVSYDMLVDLDQNDFNVSLRLGLSNQFGLIEWGNAVVSLAAVLYTD